MKPVLVVNSGSSSVKYQLIDLETQTATKSGLIERVTDHKLAFAEMLEQLGDAKPIAVGHRVVHGGPNFGEPKLVTPEVLGEIEELSELAPLHNPGNALGIKAAISAYPELPQVAVFDTAFHQTMPVSSYRYAIDAELQDKYRIRRYGFHGTSHAFVARKAAEFLNIDASKFNGIILHLGNGASACAIKNGKSFDTSMGFTPLQGLVMGSRSGDIDPAIMSYLARVANLSIQDLDASLNKNGGFKGMTGDADLRDVERRAQRGERIAIEAIEVYVQRIKHYIGAYIAEIGPIDAVVFTAGVGENSAEIRGSVIAGLEHLGLEINPELNEAKSHDARSIASQNSKVEALVIPTNEELEIALQTEKFL